MTTAFEPDSAKVRAIKLPSCRREFSGSAQSFAPRSFREEGVRGKEVWKSEKMTCPGKKREEGGGGGVVKTGGMTTYSSCSTSNNADLTNSSKVGQ